LRSFFIGGAMKQKKEEKKKPTRKWNKKGRKSISKGVA
jgi:hypothetical protein